MKPGFKISRKEELIFQSKNYDSTYGEITKKGVDQLIKQCEFKNKIVCDLGCGTGNLLKFLCIKNIKCQKLIGIELSEERCELAKKNLHAYQKKYSILIIQEDILNFSLSNCNIIYISNLCFPEWLNRALGKKIDKEIREKTVVFSSKELYCNDYVKKNRSILNQSWDSISILWVYYF